MTGWRNSQKEWHWSWCQRALLWDMSTGYRCQPLVRELPHFQSCNHYKTCHKNKITNLNSSKKQPCSDSDSPSRRLRSADSVSSDSVSRIIPSQKSLPEWHDSDSPQSYSYLMISGTYKEISFVTFYSQLTPAGKVTNQLSTLNSLKMGWSEAKAKLRVKISYILSLFQRNLSGQLIGHFTRKG